MSTLSVRLPDSLHKNIKKLSKKERISINQFITNAVAEKMTALETESYLKERANKGSIPLEHPAIILMVPVGAMVVLVALRILISPFFSYILPG